MTDKRIESLCSRLIEWAFDTSLLCCPDNNNIGKEVVFPLLFSTSIFRHAHRVHGVAWQGSPSVTPAKAGVQESRAVYGFPRARE